MIKPTVGRKVWYRPSNPDQAGLHGMKVNGDQPLDATIIAVWGDRMVNVLVTDIVGRQFPVLSCWLVQEGDEKPEGGRYVEWMPYQQGQAKASDELVTVRRDGYVEPVRRSELKPDDVVVERPPAYAAIDTLKRKLAEASSMTPLEEELAKADKAGLA